MKLYVYMFYTYYIGQQHGHHVYLSRCPPHSCYNLTAEAPWLRARGTRGSGAKSAAARRASPAPSLLHGLHRGQRGGAVGPGALAHGDLRQGDPELASHQSELAIGMGARSMCTFMSIYYMRFTMYNMIYRYI